MSTYLSHPVRRIRDDSDDGSVALVVELGGGDPETLAATVTELSGTVERELEFDCYLVDLPEMAVDALCELDEITRIETADTIAVAPRDPELASEPADSSDTER